MNTTSHARARMRQRHIHSSLIKLVLEEGVPLSRNPNRLLLTRRHLRSLWAEGQIERRLYHRAEQAVPLVCVVENGQLITVFRPTRSINRTFTSRPRHRRRRNGAMLDTTGVNR